MAPLNPTSNKCYTVSFPSDETDDRLNLKVRTGAATCIVHSRIFAHGGLTFGLNLPELSISHLKNLLATRLQDTNQSASDLNWNDHISCELFELNIVERKWMRRVSKTDQRTDLVFPKPRIFHTIVCEEGDVYISGGLTLNSQTNEFEPISDLWKYDLKSNRWVCLCDGNSSNKGRYGHSMLFFNSPSPFNKHFHQGLLIIGGKTKGDVNVPEFDFFDLTDNKWISDAKRILPIEDLRMSLPNKTEKTQKKVVATNSFDSSIILYGDDERVDESPSTLIMYTKLGGGSNSNPLIEFPLNLQSQGKRLPVRIDNYTKNVIIPSDLSNSDMGFFGDHLIVTGFGKNQTFISIYLYHKPSGKWSSLKAFCDHDQFSHTISRGFVWASHHRILLLGDHKIRNTLPSVQYFNMFMTVSLPFVNVSGSSIYYTGEKLDQPVQPQKPHEKSFIEYSRYVAPHVQMTSIKSAFPPYAVTLGRNAFDRFGYSLSDAEFVSADGESVPITLMLCRKRWGRCFEMLISKGYVRAVDTFEKSTVDPEYVANSDERSETSSIKESEEISSSQEFKDLPHFRLPFQDPNTSEQLPRASSAYLAVSSGDQSRKMSASSSTSLLLSVSPDTSKALIPPQKVQPSEQAPQLPKPKLSQQFKTPSASSSPRGSISGGLQPFSQIEKPPKESSSKDRKSPNRASRQGSKGSLGPSITRDDSSTSNSKGSFSLVSNKPSTKSVAQQLDINSSKMDPLLLPRAMYLPFATSTLRALLEFLSTGQVGSKWSIVPTTLDIVLLSKFYELPLLYDLVVEVLYSIIGNKENQLIAETNILNQQYIDTISKQGEDVVVPTLRCLEGFADFIAKFNDGILDLKILKKISKSRKESDVSSKRKKSQDSTSSGSSKLKNFSPMPPAQNLSIAAPPTISPLQQEQLVDEEEIEEGDPRYKADLPLEKEVGVGYEDEKNSSDNSSSDCIGVGIALVSQPHSEENPTSVKEDNSTRKASSQTTSESIKSKKPSASSSNPRFNSSFVQDNAWPSLGQLTAPNAPACTDVIIDFIYEMGALAGDMKLMVRAANVLDISKKFELEKKETLRILNPSVENSSTSLKQVQQKPRSLFGKFEMGGSAASGTRYEKRDSITSMLSNASSNHSTDVVSATNSRYPITSQLSSNAVERVNTFDSSKSLLAAASKSNSTGKLELATPQKKFFQQDDKSAVDELISPTVSGENTESKLPSNKSSIKLGGLLKRK